MRQTSLKLQQPCKEDEEKVIENFLFDKAYDMEENKEVLYKLWQTKRKKLVASSTWRQNWKQYLKAADQKVKKVKKGQGSQEKSRKKQRKSKLQEKEIKQETQERKSLWHPSESTTWKQ